jgi:hypothetical protein
MKGMETAGMIFLRLLQDKEQVHRKVMKDFQRKTMSNKHE